MHVVVAYGNPLRGDDGVAWHVAERLQDPDTRILLTQQLTPEIALDLKGASRVIFVDAAADGEAGRVTCARVEGSARGAASAHHLSPEGVLAYARSLNGNAPQAFIVSVAGQDFGLGERLSGHVRAALPEAVRRVRALLGTASSADGSRVQRLGGDEGSCTS
jgi:hydrogenase maturation protease